MALPSLSKRTSAVGSSGSEHPSDCRKYLNEREDEMTKDEAYAKLEQARDKAWHDPAHPLTMSEIYDLIADGLKGLEDLGLYDGKQVVKGV